MQNDADGDPDLDPSDLEAVEAWLSDPTVQALHTEFGREFRALPPEEQIEDLGVQLIQAERRRDDVARLLSEASPDDARRVLLKATNLQIEALRQRIGEVRDQPPDA